MLHFLPKLSIKRRKLDRYQNHSLLAANTNLVKAKTKGKEMKRYVVFPFNCLSWTLPAEGVQLNKVNTHLVVNRAVGHHDIQIILNSVFEKCVLETKSC